MFCAQLRRRTQGIRAGRSLAEEVASVFGKRLAAVMRASGMRPSDVAQLCGVSRSTVARWTKMERADLAARHAVCIADSTGADLRQLVTGVVRQKRARK